MRMLPSRLVLGLVGALALTATAGAATSNYTLFESGQVRPLAQSGNLLFVTNTPDNRLEIFDLTSGSPVHVGAVPVGLEPVAVAARSATQVWVVNHLSDSISIVDVTTPSTARVVRTLYVGDEPRDIVFAGPGGNRAFITTAHRGQNTPYQPTIHTELTTPGIGRADVWVFDATNLGNTLGGTPETIVQLFGDTPRALAVSADGNTVYAAVFESGNRTTALSEGVVCNGGQSAAPCGQVCAGGPNMHALCTTNSQCPSSACVTRSPGGLPAPNTDHNGNQQPEVGLIVKYDGTHWKDELNRNWDNAVNLSLPDEDVFAIDATQNPPAQSAVYTGVGTILFNMAVNPANGHVYVTNTDAQNDVRFEGAGVFSAMFKPAGEPPSVRGHLAESRITVLNGATVTPRHLNKHIDYTTCCAATPNAENDASLAFPLGIAVSSDGATMYVAGFGSSKIGVYATSDIESDSFVPGANDVTLTGLGACPGGACGPTGLVIDEARSQLYVLTRFDDGLSVVSTATGMETAHLALHSPEPASVVNGRRFNYDAHFTSSHGDSACASCHIFSDFDSLAWDLGDPDGAIINNPGPFTVGPFGSPPAVYTDFHPMKGPMTTQSLRGLANEGPMHWRGDRTGGNDAPSFQPNNGTFDEDAAFKKFNVAFPGLVGRSAQLTTAEMQAYTDFILQVTYPPNPITPIDGSIDNMAVAGEQFFNGGISDTLQNCNGCHRLAPTANPNEPKPGFFGTDGQYSFEGETQHFKIPHLRNLYQKVGMFGLASVPAAFNPGDELFMGDQVRGFGFLHDGSVDTTFHFHRALLFNQSGTNPGGFLPGTAGDPMRRNVEAFMMSFPSNMSPIVGQQTTLVLGDAYGVASRIGRFISYADNGMCDLVAKGRLAGIDRGWLYTGNDLFISDRADEPPISTSQLESKSTLTAGQEVTYTCVPPGSGVRIALDRDGDGYGDTDEIDNGSDPTDPNSTPTGVTKVCSSSQSVVWKNATLIDHSGVLSLVGNDVPLGTYAQEDVATTTTLFGNTTVFSQTIPGASIVLKGSTYKFSAPSDSTGVIRVTVKDSRKTPGLFKLKVKAKHAWTPVLVPPNSPTSAVVKVNIGGKCFVGNATKTKQ